MDEAKVYELPKSSLKFSGTTLSRHDGAALVADHALADLHEVVLRYGRNEGDVFCFCFFGTLLALSGVGFYFWGWRAGSMLWGTLFGLSGFFALAFIGMGLTSRALFLDLRGKLGKLTYPISDDAVTAEAFFAELREHAQAQRLIIAFRIQR